MRYQRNRSDIAQVDQKVTKNEFPSGTPADPIAVTVMSLAAWRRGHGSDWCTGCGCWTSSYVVGRCY